MWRRWWDWLNGPRLPRPGAGAVGVRQVVQGERDEHGFHPRVHGDDPARIVARRLLWELCTVHREDKRLWQGLWLGSALDDVGAELDRLLRELDPGETGFRVALVALGQHGERGWRRRRHVWTDE